MSKTSKRSCEFTGSAMDFLPERLELPVLREAVQGCRGCDLYCNATQAVFGEGPENAEVLFVGEQPGDQEDKAGKPFVGPSGTTLDEALEEVGIDRSKVFVTNTVKHFRFEQRGQRRIHASPSARQIAACRPWLEAELAAVKPKLVVCLGAVAAKALMGKDFRITQDRGRVFRDTDWAPALVATFHPSAILRAPDPESRERAYAQFVADLRVVKDEMREISRAQANASAERQRRAIYPGTEDRTESKSPKNVEPDLFSHPVRKGQG